MIQYSTLAEKFEGIDDQCIISNLANNGEVLQNGVHVYYAFYEKEKYINNAMNFIREGIDREHKVIFIEKLEIFEEVLARLASRGYSKNDLDSIIFVDNDKFYLSNNKFSVKTSVRNFQVKLKECIENDWFIRAWGQVSFRVDEPVLSKLRLYECGCDQVVEKHKAIIVCTYNGLTVPSYIQNEMLKTHPYFMTDDQIGLSPFYEKEEGLNIPSIEELQKLQKLDKEITLLQIENKRLQKINNEIILKKAVIAESEKFYRNLINELPISILITKNDHIVYINQTGKMNLDSKYLKGRAFSRIFNKLSSTATNGLSEYKLSLNNDDTKEKYFDIKSIPVWFEGENAILHVLIDLTQQKVNEKLIVRSEKLSIAGELAAGIAHEVRNPLTAIKGFIKLLENTSNEFYLKIVNDEISRIEQISSELLMLAKPHSDVLKTTNIVTLIKNVKTLLETQAILKNIDIELRTKEEQIFIDCEETKIRQVFINIIKNAIEVMDKGSISLHVNKLKDKVQVDIVDQGEGMSAEMLAKIGEAFYTTKEKGTGLGLMVCYKIIGNHNGEINVSSQKGVGTTFSVTLPLSSITD
ncbi:MAG TPA: two-component sensor histidine kinase [Bacillus bacterium]|nr:two-component sensor histidine kinase [Bacillus sp. (in: firmicutes)]